MAYPRWLPLAGTPTACWAVLLSALLLGCGQDGSPADSTQRPSCTAGNRDCGEGWTCVVRTMIEACTREVIIPSVCEVEDDICIAQGILTAGQSCLRDSECVEGLRCTGGAPQRCAQPQCETTAECPAGQGCRNFLCEVTDVSSLCNEEYQCAQHQYCGGGVCNAAPVEGGNPCREDHECAGERTCVLSPDDAVGQCSECERNADCADHASGPYCHQLLCALCNDDSCPGQICSPEGGCFDCAQDEHCEGELRCVRNVCLQECSFPNHDACESGSCQPGGRCVSPVGKPCPEERRGTDDCGGGTCIARDDGNASVEPYCTRECGSSQPPCPAGYVCTESVSVGGVTQDLCLQGM